MIAFSSDEYPLLLLDMGGADRSVEDVRRMFENFGAINVHARGSKTRWVLVAKTQQIPSAQERRAIADEANRFSAADRALCARALLVVQSSVVRGVITALGWLMPSFNAVIELVPSPERGVERAIAHLQELGATPPAGSAGRAVQWFRDRPAPLSVRLPSRRPPGPTTRSE